MSNSILAVFTAALLQLKPQLGRRKGGVGTSDLVVHKSRSVTYKGWYPHTYIPSGVGYEPKGNHHWAMNIQRRRATNKEIEQGEREMKLAEEMMKKEAEKTGEMPIEDVKAEGSQEGSVHPK